MSFYVLISTPCAHCRAILFQKTMELDQQLSVAHEEKITNVCPSGNVREIEFAIKFKSII